MSTLTVSFNLVPLIVETKIEETLTIDELDVVHELLKRCNFPKTRWHELGLTLGLYKNTLDIIKCDNDTTYDRLMECLSQWLCRADKVDKKGGATWNSLSNALRSMNQNAAADKLDQEKLQPARLNTNGSSLVQSLSDPVSATRQVTPAPKQEAVLLIAITTRFTVNLLVIIMLMLIIIMLLLGLLFFKM